MEKKEEADYNTKYANWNKGYEDLFQEIMEIREIQNKVLFDLNNKNLLLNQYYVRIRGLYTTLSHQIFNRKKMQDQFDKIEKVLFGSNYLNSIKKNNVSKKNDMKIYQDLRLYFQMMCESFSKNGLTMKIIKQQRDDPYSAVMRGYN